MGADGEHSAEPQVWLTGRHGTLITESAIQLKPEFSHISAASTRKAKAL